MIHIAQSFGVSCPSNQPLCDYFIKCIPPPNIKHPNNGHNDYVYIPYYTNVSCFVWEYSIYSIVGGWDSPPFWLFCIILYFWFYSYYYCFIFDFTTILYFILIIIITIFMFTVMTISVHHQMVTIDFHKANFSFSANGGTPSHHPFLDPYFPS